MRLRPCAPTRRLHTGTAASASSFTMTSGWDLSTRSTVSPSTPLPHLFPEPTLLELTSHTHPVGYYGGSSFGSPTGRAVGIGYQQEVVARLKNHTLGYSGSQINATLDNNTATFPLHQSLYFDFTHDTNIISVLTALGLKQFSGKLDPNSHPGEHNFTVSHLTPFGARLDIEIIRTPQPLAADRQAYLEGGETRYIHFVLNQRSIPLGWSHPECDVSRADGWCELGAFLKVQEAMEALARFDEACFGEFPINPYQRVEDGAPA